MRIMEKKMDTTNHYLGSYWGSIGVISGIMEKKTETTIQGLWFRVTLFMWA